MTDSVAGSFLVATPLVGGPPFWKSVVLILEHDDSGAIGLILNAPTDAAVIDHLPLENADITESDTIHVGGPVSTDTAIVVVQSPTAAFVRPSPLGDIGIADPDALPPDIAAIRVFAGYSGWDPDQLEAEIAAGAWWVMTVDRDAIFSDDIEDLWYRTVARGAGRIALHRTFPDDPSLN